MPRPLSCEYNIPMTLKLRDYQAAGNAKVREAHASGVVRPAVVLPTGGGKTVMFADLARTTVEAGDRALVLVHRDELARQTVSKVHAMAPKASIGVVKAAENGIDSGVVVASVQTLAREHRRMQLPTFGLVIVDECHRGSARDDSSWRAILDHFQSAYQLGMTATPLRDEALTVVGAHLDLLAARDSIIDGLGLLQSDLRRDRHVCLNAILNRIYPIEEALRDFFRAHLLGPDHIRQLVRRQCV